MAQICRFLGRNIQNGAAMNAADTAFILIATALVQFTRPDPDPVTP